MKKKILIMAAALALAFVVLPQGKSAVLTADAATSTATSSSGSSSKYTYTATSNNTVTNNVSQSTASSNNTVTSSSETASSDNTGYDDIIARINAAADNTTVEVSRSTGIVSLPNSIMHALYVKKTVALTMEYSYNGVDYKITIPAGGAIDSDIPWYGPLYLAYHYGNGATADTYTIKKGDTLYKIARANGMKLSTLQQLNAEIAAQKYIFPGQVLKLK